MKRLILLGFALALTGCAPQLIAANSAGGMVNHSNGLRPDSRRGAFKVANDYCKTMGKVAQVRTNDPWSSTMTFDCVAP